jgi:hypothetical protein
MPEIVSTKPTIWPECSESSLMAAEIAAEDSRTARMASVASSAVATPSSATVRVSPAMPAGLVGRLRAVADGVGELGGEVDRLGDDPRLDLHARGDLGDRVGGPRCSRGRTPRRRRR